MQSPKDTVGRHRSGDAFEIHAAAVCDEGDFVTLSHGKQAADGPWDCDLPFSRSRTAVLVFPTCSGKQW